MTSGRLRFADRRCGVALTVLVSLLSVSCSSTGEPNFDLTNPAANAATTTETTTTQSAAAAGAPTVAQATMSPAGDTALPDQVGYVPLVKPGAENAAEVVIASAEQPQQPATAAAAEQPTTEAEAAQTAEAKTAKPPAQQDTGFILTNGPAAEPEAPKKKGLFASLFGSSSAKAAPAPAEQKAKPLIAMGDEASDAKPKAAEEKAKPIITLASAKAETKPVELASLGGSSGGDSNWALPGVRTTDLFEIKRKSGLNDDSDVDLHEDEDPGLELASAAGMARLAPNGLLKQTESVDVACLKPSLVRILKAAEQHYGKKMIVTSGYRNPERNRRARGAKNSQHMYCAAADIQIPGVGKWELASYLRAMPGRGGVGTYCHTNSVHIDVGPERDWNWRCGRRRG
ncbi:YcbK family protein [Aminobacter anthyllidis]|uniref:YcbK family protein n=1 Tax=Aminobacter anthyllidis TaxID=1035067 RepID=UPI001FE43658|nr:YcbK family protein [Aminobacter anthyllidis]